MNIIDISWPISPSMTAYKDRQIVSIEQIKNFDSDQVRESILRLGAHSGTHVDAPAHFIRDGKKYDQLSIDMFIGPCMVIDVTNVEKCITDADLIQKDIQENSIILFKTRNSFLSSEDNFNTSFVYLDITGARYLVQKKIKAVGIDYLGIERAQPMHETHLELMQNNVGIIEGLRLQGVEAGSYMFYCLPLAVFGTEASPARAILIR